MQEFLNWDEYSAYINSEEWRKKKTERLLMDDNRCQLCGISCENLDVHHIMYPERFGDERLCDLITLCRKCHKLIHEIRKGQVVVNKKHVVMTDACIKFKTREDYFEIRNEFKKRFHSYGEGIRLKIFVYDDFRNTWLVHSDEYFGLKIKDIIDLRKQFGNENVVIFTKDEADNM